MITPQFNTNLDNQPEPETERSSDTGERKPKPNPMTLIGQTLAVILMIGVTALAGSLIIALIAILWKAVL